MKIDEIRSIIEVEISKKEPFINFHGITRKNLRSFLVEPYEILVDSDDLETEPRNMWVVLQESKSPEEGYLVVYDPAGKIWGVAEHLKDNNYILVIVADSFTEALDGM
jgi:hypothetical protein